MTTTEEEPEELVKFRQAWKAELLEQKITNSIPEPAVPVPKAQPAVEIYRRAVQFEQQSRLDDALRLYRQAFRIDPNVERAFHHQEILLTALADPHLAPSTSSRDHSKHSKPSKPSNTTQIVHAATILTGTLATLVSQFPPDLTFVPADPLEPNPLASLPEEVLVLILSQLDACAIERFAAATKKARIVTLDPSIWRTLVERAYREPIVVEDLETVVAQYEGDYRRLYVEHPRVRMDGMYIAVCHYVRPGLSDNVWVIINHPITYYRYLRFLPTGQVLSLLSNDELKPQSIIPQLKPTLRMKGLFIGTWQQDGTTVRVRNLVDASTKSTLKGPPLTPLTSQSRYVFQMELGLRSKPLGRWNKLELTAYDSVLLETGEAVPVGVKRERPFWFSRVRSWM